MFPFESLRLPSIAVMPSHGPPLMKMFDPEDLPLRKLSSSSIPEKRLRLSSDG
jgi:hypothetical protein